MEKSPLFNANDFLKQITKVFGSQDMAAKAIRLYDQYQFCVGLIVGSKASYFFDSESDLNRFKSKYGESLEIFDGAPIYNSNNFERVLVAELGINNLIASKFTDAEFSYLEQIGAA